MFDGIAEHEDRKTKLPIANFFFSFLRNCLFFCCFFLIYFYLTI